MPEEFDPRVDPVWSQPCRKCGIKMENHRDANGIMTSDCALVVLRNPR